MTTIIFPGRYDQLSEISNFVEGAAVSAGLSRNDVYSVQLAVDEACANIIDHAYGGEGRGEIICTCQVSEKGLTITLQDFGKPFNPDEVPLPKRHTDLHDIEVGGLGLYFIHTLMDEVQFQFDPASGNTLKMYKEKEKGSKKKNSGPKKPDRK